MHDNDNGPARFIDGAAIPPGYLPAVRAAVDACALAVELFGDDELEGWAREHGPD